MRSFIDFVACLFKIFSDDESKKKRAIHLLVAMKSHQLQKQFFDYFSATF